ncbi:hypothetical protein FE257_003013 [Aspergillus nanangensis]|uniref:Atos-like conserved domain-containing protein n=1 Tax=Aspergillus nanangensis TaxID=2582783 RepID=A0AAD4GNT9_ASPNN|nr:hypothetical protein FE257_003013 [Aspergillus nanangensis]
MPIFQDPDRQRFYNLWSDDRHGLRKQEQQSCLSHGDTYRGENPGPGSSEPARPFVERANSSSHNRSALRASDREGLIQYIKNADTAAWGQNSSFEGVSAGHYNQHNSNEPPVPGKFVGSDTMSNTSHPNSSGLASPAEIERPRSALHSGDFREGASQSQAQQPSPPSPLPGNHVSTGFLQLGSSPTTPWFTTPVFSSPFQNQLTSNRAPQDRLVRSRAPSLGSFSSSYVLKTPTSPLVHQANNTDLDFSPRIDADDQLERPEKVNRRRTLPPESFTHLQSSPTSHRGGTFNFQSGHSFGAWDDPLPSQPYHPPGRSMACAYSLQLASSVQAPFPRARKPSISSDVSSKPHAPMVGPYEESLLCGRMSMNPSKPLDFTAQIGVLGKGKCKSNLRCPPHVTVPFPAVFYSYPTSGKGRSISDDSPSPYVGSIDLDNSLPRDTLSTSRRRRHHASPAGIRDDHNLDRTFPSKLAGQDTLRKREKKYRRADSPKSPPGGCYRIPQQGQLQIIIKNPNKTAVKLFLVPYDLRDMEPGSKTFIRQRSYSAGPIIDMPLNARKNFGTDRPEASLNTSEDPNDKPVLRYLIHLNICSPSRGRFYLHSSIRVVFANRVPDGKERLRNEIQHPDPRYSPYKPSKDTGHTHGSAKSLVDRGLQRPASGLESVSALHPNHHTLASMREKRTGVQMQPTASKPSYRNPLDQQATPKMQHPFQPIPSLREEVSPLPSPSIGTHHQEVPGVYNKLSKGDIGYGGYPFGTSGPNGPEHGESLLAKRLRGLDVQKHDSQGPYIN